jgi:hypothetical protein
LSAFANTRGGILIIGADDRGYARGLTSEEAEVALRRLLDIARSMFRWPVTVAALRRDDESRIVYAVIPRTPENSGPVLTAEGDLYQRRGNQLVKLSDSEELAALTPGARRPTSTSRSCTAFVAMSFREEEEPAVVDYFRAMQRAVARSRLPITLRRIDLVEGDYEVSQGIMDAIDTADIVITDFTLSPKNVYFELGYARGRKKRVIQTARKGEILEFDVRNWRTAFYRNATELEDKLVSELIAAYAEFVDGAS